MTQYNYLSMKNTQNIFAESKIFMTYQSKISKSELKRL